MCALVVEGVIIGVVSTQYGIIVSLSCMHYFVVWIYLIPQWWKCVNLCLFDCLFVGWMYDWNGRVCFGSKQTARRAFALIAACLSARSCNLAHSYALFFCCPNTLQWMSMTPLLYLRLFVCSFVQWMYGWNGRTWCCATQSARSTFVFIACCLHECLKLQSRSPSCAILVSKYNTINGNDDSVLVFVGWLVECMERLSCWSALHEQRIVRLCL